MLLIYNVAGSGALGALSSPLICESECAVTYSKGPWGGKTLDSLTGGQKESAQLKINQPGN